MTAVTFSAVCSYIALSPVALVPKGPQSLDPTKSSEMIRRLSRGRTGLYTAVWEKAPASCFACKQIRGRCEVVFGSEGPERGHSQEKTRLCVTRGLDEGRGLSVSLSEGQPAPRPHD